MLTRYMKIKPEGKARWDYEFTRNHINILGFEHIDKEYQDSINGSCHETKEAHDAFLQKAVDKIQDYIKTLKYPIHNVLIECTTIMQIVPLLKKSLPQTKIIGITEAMKMIINVHRKTKQKNSKSMDLMNVCV